MTGGDERLQKSIPPGRIILDKHDSRRLGIAALGIDKKSSHNSHNNALRIPQIIARIIIIIISATIFNIV
jgi:hypothetical protein